MIRTGSVLESKLADEVAMTQEDLEANAFAGLLLMPEGLLREQIYVFLQKIIYNRALPFAQSAWKYVPNKYFV